MKRLPINTENELLKLMRRHRTHFDEAQARLDLAGILARFPAHKALEAERQGNHKTDVRILAEIAADVYFHHTGRQPGRTEKLVTKAGVELRIQAGQYQQFVAVLARAGKIDFDPAKLPNVCREVQRALNKKARLPRLPTISLDDPDNRTHQRQRELPGREEARAKILREHIEGYEDLEGNFFSSNEVRDVDGLDPVFGGYEAARLARPPEEVFAGYLKTIKREPTSGQ